jgi:hypothetical protein
VSLPTSRPRTYAALSQLFSVDLNAIFDSIINLYLGQRGDEITPSQISGTTNNYAPGATAGVIRQGVATGSPGATLTGLVASQIAGRRLTIVNISVDGDLLVKHQSGTSTAANRFALPGNVDLTIPFNTNKAATFVYDNTAQRWLLESKNF